MSAVLNLYHLVFYQPLLNILVFLYNTAAFHDFGLAIILSTVFIRLILFPLFHQSARQQILIQKIQPHLKKIQELHKNDMEKRSQAMMALYKEHKINPFSGFFLIIIQLPILFALYGIFLHPLTAATFKDLYSFVTAPSVFNHTLFGLTDLEKSSIIIVALAALAQYFQVKLTIPPSKDKNEKPDVQQKISKQMMFIGPVLTFVIFLRFPAAVSLYWFVTSLFSILQQIIVNRNLEAEQKLLS